MPVSNSTPIEVDDTPVQLLTGTSAGEGQSMIFVGDGAWFLGGPNVTTANGIPISANEKVVVDLAPGDKWYAVTSGATVTIRVCKSRSQG